MLTIFLSTELYLASEWNTKSNGNYLKCQKHSGLKLTKAKQTCFHLSLEVFQNGKKIHDRKAFIRVTFITDLMHKHCENAPFNEKRECFRVGNTGLCEYLLRKVRQSISPLQNSISPNLFRM